MDEILKELSSRCTGKKNSRMHIFDTTINPGETTSFGLPLPELLGYTPFYMPIKIIHGKTEGPCILLFATMRGDEFNGMEIINRLLKRSALKKLSGTIIAVPVLNVYGMLNRSRFLPDGQLLDRAFPGKEYGNYAARLAYLFTDRLLGLADVCVEYSSGQLNRNILPHVYTDLSREVNRALAYSFQVSVITNSDLNPGTIHSVAGEENMPILTYRAGEAMRFSKKAIRMGVRGTIRLLRNLDMLPADRREKKEAAPAPLIAQRSSWIYATKSGIAYHYKKVGDRVAENDDLARISEPWGSFAEVTVKAPREGIIVGSNDMPLVYEGDALFMLGRFKELDEAADTLRAWPDQNGPAG